MKKQIVYISSIIIVIFFALILKPVPIQTKEEAQQVQGVVESITEAGTKDLVFRLKGSDKQYYINRGLENGLQLQKLQQDLIGKSVTIIHPKYWTPLDPFSQTRHISKLTFKGKNVFSEL